MQDEWTPMKLTQVDENGRCDPWGTWVNPDHIVYMKPIEYYIDPHPGPSTSTKKRKKATGTRINFLGPSIVVQETFEVVTRLLPSKK